GHAAGRIGARGPGVGADEQGVVAGGVLRVVGADTAPRVVDGLGEKVGGAMPGRRGAAGLAVVTAAVRTRRTRRRSLRSMRGSARCRPAYGAPKTDSTSTPVAVAMPLQIRTAGIDHSSATTPANSAATPCPRLRAVLARPTIRPLTSGAI